MSMLADAMDEGLCLVRLVDNEDVDPAEIAGYVRNFVARIKSLFCEGACFDEFGYTKHCVDTLADGSLVIFDRYGEPQRLRAPTAGEKQRCLQRMKNWVKLALEVVETEFPNYSLICAFEIFDLRAGARGPGDMRAVTDNLEDWRTRSRSTLLSYRPSWRGIAPWRRKSCGIATASRAKLGKKQ